MLLMNTFLIGISLPKLSKYGTTCQRLFRLVNVVPDKKSNSKNKPGKTY